jgi:hypothetical protein
MFEEHKHFVPILGFDLLNPRGGLFMRGRMGGRLVQSSIAKVGFLP